ncbi:MAG: hypothetical protein IPO00_02800 [Betaproteobacteria bacterium]|nr:hypothetical protein [Betaproteobacteria bacterium]
MNGVVKRTVTTTADRSFYFDSSFYEVGAAIKDVHFGSGAPKGVQLAYAPKEIPLRDDAAGNRRTATTMEGGYLATESYNYAP